MTPKRTETKQEQSEFFCAEESAAITDKAWVTLKKSIRPHLSDIAKMDLADQENGKVGHRRGGFDEPNDPRIDA